MIGFLQGFHQDDILIEMRDDQVVRYVVEKAIEIAMLGMPEQFNAICRTLATHGKLKSLEERLEFQCIWKYSGLNPPDLDNISKDAVWVIPDEELRKKSIDASPYSYMLDWLDWKDVGKINRSTIEKLEQLIESATDDPSTTGYPSMQLSVKYAALIKVAYHLNLPDVVTKHMPKVMQRIHANQQAYCLSFIPNVWKDYLVPGHLRKELGLSEESIKEYAQYVDDVADKRFRHGPLRPEELYPDFSIAQLLKVIDQNTVSDERYRDFDENPDVYENKLQENTIMREPATEQEIAQAEARFGRPLPEDIKEFFRLTNGCTRVLVGQHFFISCLPPLDDMFLEQDGYMDDYGFSFLPLLPNSLYHKMDWPGFPDGGIAMYEHNGQGTDYVWILGADDIKRAKERLEKAYKVLSDDEKAIIDRSIVYWFGSREAFDACQDHCYHEVHWGDEAQGTYPTFKAFLARVAARTEHRVERSPVKLPKDLEIF